MNRTSLAHLPPTVRAAVWLSLALLALRLHTARGLGYGDAEALYACYALFPQPGYLDHPGLIGLLLRLLGGGSAPSAAAAHVASALTATLVPWLGALVARSAGVELRKAARVVLALALVPELAVGLFGVTPDLPLAVCWLGALSLALFLARHGRERSKDIRVLLAWLALGVLLGLGVLAKVSMLLLALGLLAFSCSAKQRVVWRGYGPWCTVACASILVLPLGFWEASHGFAMLKHRLIASQTDWLPTFTSLGKFLGGQLLYVTPPFLLAAYVVGRDLYQKRHDDASSALLWWCLLVPFVVLVPLSVWSSRAEPHWVAPALLALAVHAARSDAVSLRLARACLATGALFVAVVWLSVTSNAYIWLAKSPVGQAFGGYRERYDLTNDLYAWGPGSRLLRDAVLEVVQKTGKEPSVIGTPHWMICAQAQVALGPSLSVGCYTALKTDFDDWLPRERWRQAQTLLVVEDSRYPLDVAREFPEREIVATWRTGVRRGPHVVRTIRVTRLDQRLGTARLPHLIQQPKRPNPSGAAPR